MFLFQFHPTGSANIHDNGRNLVAAQSVWRFVSQFPKIYKDRESPPQVPTQRFNKSSNYRCALRLLRSIARRKSGNPNNNRDISRVWRRHWTDLALHPSYGSRHTESCSYNGGRLYSPTPSSPEGTSRFCTSNLASAISGHRTSRRSEGTTPERPYHQHDYQQCQQDGVAPGGCAVSKMTFFVLSSAADCVTHRPTREHTELEEELHEIAHIDYDRVAIVRVEN
jgi:hypothetical protein